MRHKIVAVGASAGGLEALEEFFGAVPVSSGMAFFVIQHLSPDRDSMLAELLGGHCKLPVVEVEDGQSLEPNRVYLSPPGFVPVADGLRVRLKPRPAGSKLSLPINVYFESLAKTFGDRAVGVILSGTGSDGTEGAKEIRDHGGQVYAQFPGEADFSGMPQSVISADLLTGVADASELWALIVAGCGQAQVLKEPAADSGGERGSKNSSKAGSDDDFDAFFTYLYGLFDIDFSNYRLESVERRIRRRMSLLAIPKLADYLTYLKEVEDETHALHHDLLIGVTDFFRDGASYKLLGTKVLEPIFEHAVGGKVRIWSAACATGEEAYSLYILAAETARNVGYKGSIQIFGTDISKVSIDKASLGCFTEEQLEGLDDELQSRYFDRFSENTFKVKSNVRERIVFAKHNFMVDPPFAKIDLVSCRNVLIYLTPEAQEVALRAFSYALREDGYLFLGASESLGKYESWYKALEKRERIFQRCTPVLDSTLWAEPKIKGRERKGGVLHLSNSYLQSVRMSKDLLSAYDSLLGRFSIDGFLINRENVILHYFGNAADYCINLQGRLSTDLPSQLDKNFRLALITLTHRAATVGERVSAKKLDGKSRKGSCCVDLSVEPLMDMHGNSSILLVDIVERQEIKSATPSPSPELAGAGHTEMDRETLDRYRLLEQDLRYAKDNLEAANEEVLVSHEKLQCLNEEFEVTNEELQSANEELQSTNEELTTLNSEYERKNHELDELNANHEKLLQSTQDGVLYLDKDLCIRRFNHAIDAIFHLLPSDVGRSLTQIAYKLDNIDKLIEEVRGILAGASPEVERESIELEGRYYMKRVVPVMGRKEAIEGALLTFTDITEVSALSQRFKLAVQAAHMSWWDWDLESGALSVFSAGECLLGDGCLDVSRDREGWLSQVHPDDREEVTASLDAHLAGESEEWICEHRFMASSAAWLWVRNRGVVTRRDAEGKALEMMGMTQDIDSYKKALLRSNYQNELLEAAGEIIGLGVWEWDPSTNQVYYSSQTRQILGVGEDFNPNAEESWQFFPQPGRDKLAKLFYALVEDGAPYDIDIKCINAKGQHLLTRAAGRPKYDNEGRLTRVVGLFQDITETIKTEHEMQAYFSLSPDFQATLGFDGQFKNVSKSWSTLLGYAADELLAMPLLKLMHPDDRDAFDQQFQAAVNGGGVSSYQSRVLDHKRSTCLNSGEEIWMSWSMASDEPLGLVFISARIVTEERKASQRLKAARTRAEEASSAKSDFLAVMSHELRTPLNPILGFSELLLEEVENPEHKEIAKTIVEAGSHLVELIDEVLDYSKAEAGKLHAENVEFSMEDLLEEKIRLMSGQLKGGGKVEMRSELDKGPFEQTELPVFVGDSSMLNHILRNLIANAIKFTEEGYVRLGVRVDSASAGKAVVSFEVEDTGIGIDPAGQENIFEAFMQVDSSMTRRYGGTGLGLAICKRFVELMGGAISVSSEPGKGALFQMQIPLRYVSEDKPDAQVPEEAYQAASPAPPLRLPHEDGSRKILLVEDNEDNRFFLEELVKRIGFDPVSASTGEDGLEIFKRGDVQFAAILLDLHMPGMGGLNTLKAIRECKKESGSAPIPVFILTADVRDKIREECLAHGADGFISKPVAKDALRAAFAGLETVS